jgi:hypothetical protein
MRTRAPAGRIPKTPEDLIPPPPLAVPTVVAGRAQRPQIRNVIRAAVATLDNVIDDQAATETSPERGAVACRTAVAISLEDFRPYASPGLRAVEAVVYVRPLARRRRPARRSECRWFDGHDAALRIHSWLAHTRGTSGLLVPSVASVLAAESPLMSCSCSRIRATPAPRFCVSISVASCWSSGVIASMIAA